LYAAATRHPRMPHFQKYRSGIFFFLLRALSAHDAQCRHQILFLKEWRRTGPWIPPKKRRRRWQEESLLLSFHHPPEGLRHIESRTCRSVIIVPRRAHAFDASERQTFPRKEKCLLGSICDSGKPMSASKNRVKIVAPYLLFSLYPQKQHSGA